MEPLSLRVWQAIALRNTVESYFVTCHSEKLLRANLEDVKDLLTRHKFCNFDECIVRFAN